MSKRIGESFGDWTIIDNFGYIGKKCRVKAKCKCGNIHDLYLSTLLDGSSTKCKSCSMRIRGMKGGSSPKVKLWKAVIGMKFNMLTITGEFKTDEKKRRWVLCSCECGTVDFPVMARSLSSGNTKSCGCLHSIKGKKIRARADARALRYVDKLEYSNEA